MLEVAGRCALRVQLKVIKDNAKEAVSIRDSLFVFVC